MGYLNGYSELLMRVSESDIEADVTLASQLVLDRSDKLIVSYAPFDHIQVSARLVIVGITPGAQQARNALIEARRQLLSGATEAAVLSAAKIFASFSGPMRANLVAMLDHIGLNRWLGLPSVSAVWDDRSDLVHFTSAIRYPTFIDGKNYSGSPSMTATPLLSRVLAECLGDEAKALPDAIWVPLGPKAAEATLWLTERGLLKREQIIEGLPHPSGANAERIAYFLGRKERTSLSAKTSPAGIDAARQRLTTHVDRMLRMQQACGARNRSGELQN